ncbi:protein SPT2 homolog [Macrosteles quadrilineatus]|uniref:protein SPT2 homolog n=1 Tax=Macrosteles quadrilineatus TaxID=74068 RepID=UPI0023E340E8|nr:protein SPT2 homolog [Macrosteles quadrilineatus]
MDFGSVLYTAHKNEKITNKEVKCYKTKFDPPKKEVKPPKPNLSANIQKYLQKREEEEKRRAEEEKRKKEELIALRNQDKKAFKRVQTMLKRTKSANKSVMEDAIDEVNTVVTMAGPQQCDEDDYGYVSKEASEFYSKMMDKYANMPPEEPKFSLSKKTVPKDLNAAKDRVKAALQRVEEEEMMPHKRKRKSKSDKHDEENGNEDDDDRRRTSRESSPVEEKKPKKPKKMAPPPIDFSSLLKLAEQKQFEPIKIEKKMEDEERPMTKKQRLEYERELESRRRKEEREAMRLAAVNKRSKSSDSGERKEKPNGLGRIPKKSNAADSKPKQEMNQRYSGGTDDHQGNGDRYSNTERQKSKNTLESERSYSNSGTNDYRKDSSILKSRLSTTDDQKPLKPKQPSISSNKIKSRNHNISDDEESDASDSGYEKSQRSYSSHLMEHQSERSTSYREYEHRPSSGSERGNAEKYKPKKYSNNINECTDSQSSNDSRKYNPTKLQPNSEASHHKYKPQAKYKTDVNGNKHDLYKPYHPEKQSSKLNSSSNGNGRSYSPVGSSFNNGKYSNNRKQSSSDSEDEMKYRPSTKGSSSYKPLYRDKVVESDEDQSQSPGYSSQEKKRKVSYSEPESEHDSRNGPPTKKLSTSKVKKISSLFEGSDDEQSSNHDKVRVNEDRRPKMSTDHKRHNESDVRKSKPESDRQKHPSSDSKFKIPKSSKSESEKSKSSESDRYRSSENSKSSHSLKPSSKDTQKYQQESSKSERVSLTSKPDGDRKRPGETSSFKPRPSTESLKTDTKENIKKTAEEVLKKSADVWSKPCNQSPSNPSPRPLGGLSESQLQRLREMNKKPTLSKPPENRIRSGPSENRSSLIGRSDGRPAAKPGLSPQGKPSLLMKAAAERGAKAQMASSRSNESSVNKSRDLSAKDSRLKQGEIKPKQFPPNDLKPKQFPPSDLRPRQFPPKDVRPRQFPPPDVKRKPKPRRIEDSDDEYDSDMDSFIDDSTDLRAEDISREIQQIFGYDKSRYAGMDDDDECMESNFGQIDREELRSLQIGAKEDYEELMRDLARKKRAKQRKLMEKGKR